MPKKNPLHQSPEERLAASSETTNTKLDGVTGAINELHATTREKNDTGTIRKLDEIKSAHLITNKHLKDMAPAMQRSGNAVDFIEGFLKQIKGDKGDAPTPQEIVKLIKPLIPPSEPGYTPRKGVDYFDGYTPRKGVDYFDGKNANPQEVVPLVLKKLPPPPKKGVDYFDGDDGSPDTGDEIIEKVNSSEKHINPRRITGLYAIMETVDQIGKNPQGQMQNVGGANQERFLSNGTLISAFVTEINFSSGITAVYSGNGRITLTAAGGGASTTYTETPVGTINGSNKVFTTANAITTVINFQLNSAFVHPVEYSVVGSTITFVTAPDASLSGLPFTIIYQ